MFGLVFTFFYGTSLRFTKAETLGISHTDIPPTIKVALTGEKDGRKWLENGGVIKEVIEVPFQEYVKNVVGFEWRYKSNDTADTLGAVEFQKVAAIAVKTTSLWKMNLPPEEKLSRHRLPGHPHIIDNTVDHVYIDPTCTEDLLASEEASKKADEPVHVGKNTPLCKGLIMYRTPGDFRDQAVDATWTTLLKRKDCVDLEKTCPNVFAVQYRTESCGTEPFCVPQKTARNEAETMAWEEILTKYYKTSALLPPAIYEHASLQERHTVEALSSCLMIQQDWSYPDKFALYRCKARNGKNIEKMHYPYGSNIPMWCNDKKTCPLKDRYLDVGTKGVIVDIKDKLSVDPVTFATVKETRVKVKWRVKPGIELDTNDLTPGNDLEGWSSDRDLKPIGDGVSPLVQVRITGATIKP